jgi:methylated-DNA-[protein]-cysteine S-methyltransferase
VKFDKGPKVTVSIQMKEGKIHSSHLSLSSQFTCIGAPPSLLDWFENYSQKVYHPLSLIREDLSRLEQKVLQKLSLIPIGKTISYKELALLCETPKGARAIGNACGKNPFPLLIPCHRVIRANGELGGFALDLEIKKRLLEFEKIST